MEDLTTLTAVELVTRLQTGEAAPIEALDALEERINLVESEVNALPIRFLAHAREELLDWQRPSTGSPHSMLAGLPIAVKDYNDVGGQITSHGSPVYAQNRVTADDATVTRLRRAGGIPYAKSNVPEIAGGHTYNRVWGVTRNPWNTNRTAGGSSGGSAAALASGTAWLATGSDLGGSLRTPSGYNGTVAIRPTPGLVPRSRPGAPFDPLLVDGPMARNVADCALMLDVMQGFDRHDPLSGHGGVDHQQFVGREPARFRAGYSADLGTLPVDQEIRQITSGAVDQIAAIGGDVTGACPDFRHAYETFQTLRAHLLATLHSSLLNEPTDQVKDDIRWNLKLGRDLSSHQLRTAERQRAELVHNVIDFFDDHDVLVCPTAPLAAFPADWDWPKSIEGQAMSTYIDWIAITFFISLTGCPVLALPCGRTAAGTPIGLQLIGAPRSEGALISLGHQLEKRFGIAEQLPIDPRTGDQQ